MFGEQQRFVLLLIAPAALLMLLFQVLPIVIGANASFRDWALYNPKKIWVGLAHYQAVITDPAFLYVVLPNTFLFMVLSVAGALVRLCHYPADRHLAVDAVVHAAAARRAAEPAEGAVRGRRDRRHHHLARVPFPDAADAAPRDRRLRGDPRHRRLPHFRHRLDL